MAIELPTVWSDSSAYSVGDLVDYEGSIYECVIAIDEMPGGGNPTPISNPAWKLDGIVEIRSWYSLQEAIKLALNVDDSRINNSIPMFIQMAELAIGKILRSPAQIITRNFETDDQSRFKIPEDILEIVHMRRDVETSGYSLADRGGITIEVAVDRQQYESVKQNYNQLYRNSYLAGQLDWPVYWNDGTHFYIAPDLPVNDGIELTYYADVPMLGTYVLRVNDDYEPLNAENMTLAEWVEAGNDPDDFVQAEDFVTANLWTVTCPHLLRIGALVAAETYLEDHQMIPVWKTEYVKVLAETEELFSDFNNLRQRSQTMISGYFQ